jgi:hypothetical protein
MKRLVVAALGAAALLTFGVGSAAQAAVINFSAAAFGGAVIYTGTSLDESSSLSLDAAALLVGEIGPGDASGLAKFDTFTITPPDIIYGFGAGPGVLPGAGIVKAWTGGADDMFTETLTAVDSINRMTPDAITVKLSGTVSDTAGKFVDTPISLLISASQVGGPGNTIAVMFTESTEMSGGVPETSTWVMMGLGFGALGYVASRRRKANIAVLSA